MVETWLSRPITDKTTTRSSSLTQQLKPSNLLAKTPSQLISRTQVVHQIFRFGTLTPGGSSSSSMTTVLLLTSRMEEQWMSLATMIGRTRTWSCSRDTTPSTSNGTLSTWMPWRLQSKTVNGGLSLEFTVKKNSPLLPRCQAKDILM